MAPGNHCRKSLIIALAVALALSVGGCKSPNLESARRFAYVASFSSPTTVKVKKRQNWVINDRLKSIVGAVPKPDPRSVQVLRRYGLDEVWQDDPDEAILRLGQQVADAKDLDSIFALANLKFVWAERLRLSGRNQRALSEYAHTTVLAYRFLFAECFDQSRNAYDPNFRGICDLYNQSLEHLLRIIDRENTLRPNYRYQIKTDAGEIRFETVVSGRFRHENIEDLRFVTDFETKGLENQYRTFGLGVPLIADWKVEQSQSPVAEYYPPGLSIPLTAFLQVKNKQTNPEDSAVFLECTLHLYDPLEQTEIQVGNRTAPLESDVSTPLALFLNDPLLNTKLLGILSMINNDLAREVRGLYMLEPYDPNKIPVVLVHGLASSPTTWTDMFNDLRADPRLRDHYQFWFYMYPSGQPFWVSATQMRSDMRKVRQLLDDKKQTKTLDEMVYVGHSMGGLVSRLQTIHSDDLFWKLISNRSPNELQGDVAIRQELLQTFHFQPNPAVRRVITIGSPHMGSDFANGTTIWLSRSFFKISDMFEGTKNIVKQNPDFFSDSKLLSIKTSIDSLSPESPFFKAMQKARIAPWVKYHNIYGNTKQMDVISVVGSKVIGPGDGIVPVESARAIRAESELQVNANHTGIQSDPRTIQEVKRILVQNLVESGRMHADELRRFPREIVGDAWSINHSLDPALDSQAQDTMVPYQSKSELAKENAAAFSWPSAVDTKARIRGPHTLPAESANHPSFFNQRTGSLDFNRPNSTRRRR